MGARLNHILVDELICALKSPVINVSGLLCPEAERETNKQWLLNYKNREYSKTGLAPGQPYPPIIIKQIPLYPTRGNQISDIHQGFL